MSISFCSRLFGSAVGILMFLGTPATLASANLEIVKVADGVYAAFVNPLTRLGANSGFVIGEKAVWVFDTQRPDVSAELLSEIRKLTSVPVKFVIHSHHHDERVDGNSVFTEATIIGHANMRRNLIANPSPTARLPDITYEEELIFHDGERELRLLHLGRAHTDGDSLLFLPREKVLFIGELLPSKGRSGGFREAYVKDFIQTLDKILALDFDWIIPGRGESLATKDDLRKFQNYIAGVMNEVQKFVDRDATYEETLAGVKVPDYITSESRSRPAFSMLWGAMVRRTYEELKGARNED